MQHRSLGSTGYTVSSVGFGAWALGGDWGPVDDAQSMRALHRAVDRGVTLFDTADVYGDGRSERLLARLRRERDEPFIVATKIGRRLQPHTAEGYTPAALRSFVERSLRNLDVEVLDLVQLHCPPTDVYYRPDVFDAMDALVQEGAVRHYGVSVERVEEGLKALEYPGVRSVQIVFNLFRQRPAERFLAEAARRDVGILARVPLASGLLTGRIDRGTTFPADDHRAYNRNGERFDRGETFSGVDLDAGLRAVDQVRAQVPEGMTMAQLALRWILMFPEVSTVIPGAKSPGQVDDNTGAADLPPIPPGVMQSLAGIYTQEIRPLVHQRW